MMGLVERAEGYRLLGLALAWPEPQSLRSELGAARDVGALRPFGDLADVVDDTLPEEYARLFSTSVAVSPYESAYLRTDKGAHLGQLAALYEMFGVRSGGGEHEIVDHAGAQAEFMATLCVLIELARRRQEAEGEGVAARAREVFATEHLGRWFPELGSRLADASAHPFYARLGALLAWWVKADLEENGWSAEAAAPPRADDDEACVTCPMSRGEDAPAD